MTQIFEPVDVGIILEHEPDCPFCKSNMKEKPIPLPVTKIVANWDEDAVADAIDNDSGDLEENMKKAKRPRPTNWVVDMRMVGESRSHKLVANPHHLIPGNESLACADTLLEWIFASGGKIENDIGYDVNNAQNGIWLPSNNSMRGVKWWEGDDEINQKTKFVVQAMDKAGRHFHDRHNDPYSEFVTEILNKIADRMNGVSQKGCPYEKEASGKGKYKPPYSLVARLNGVSNRIKPYLSATAKPNRRLYTSKLVMEYWKAIGKAPKNFVV
jgi:hypothetical protein